MWNLQDKRQDEAGKRIRRDLCTMKKGRSRKIESDVGPEKRAV